MKILIALLCFLQGAVVNGLPCPELNNNSTVAEHNMAWTCEQINWRNALAKWKQLAEKECNISVAEEYWSTVFKCPDFTNMTCFNELSRDNETDLFNCSIIFCNDGIYTDDTVFLEIWRQHFHTHKTIMMIYESKLIDCGKNECLESDAITIQAWNSQSQRYSELSLLLTQADDRIQQLEYNSSVWHSQAHEYSKLSEDFEDINEKVHLLGNQTTALNIKVNEYSNLSSRLLKSDNRIQHLENKSADTDAQSEKHSKDLEEMSVKVQKLENQTADMDAQSQNHSKDLVDMNVKVQSLENQTAGWDSTTKVCSELSIASGNATKNIKVLESRIGNLTTQDQEKSDALLKADSKISQLENISQAQAQNISMLYEALTEADNKIIQLENVSEAQTHNISTLYEALAEAVNRISQLENISQGYCPIKYNGKCFWVEVRASSYITFDEGRQICESQGAAPANIYSQDQFIMMMGYARMFANINGAWMFAWLGMTYDSDAKAALLSNGSAAPYVKWGKNNPNSNCCNMYLVAQMNTGSTEQYMYTSSPSSVRRGVFCEK